MDMHNYCDFNNQVESLTTSYISLWHKTSEEFPTLNRKTTMLQKLINEFQIERFRKKLNKETNKMPASECDINKWSDKVFALVKELECKIVGTDIGIINYFTKQDYPNTTKVFIDEVKRFDPKMNVLDIFQAMRNVWIMNSIQILFNKKVKITPSIFSYSMLYPYSDNFLDDPSINSFEKKEFNDRFKECLCGEQVQAINYREDCIYKLVNKIEREFSRERFPQVFHSLIAIHSAQEKSVLQQLPKNSNQEEDIINISFEKGGTSVLADGYLVKGDLSHQESNFIFGYGVLLQLIDDLQDVEEDLENGHMTLFSQAAKLGYLDILTNKLFSFIKDVLSKIDNFLATDALKLKKIIYESCVVMIIEAISKNKKMFHKEYLQKIQDYSMVRLSYYKKLKWKFQRQYQERDLERMVEALYQAR